MLAPHRLFYAILQLLEARKDEPITQQLIDISNKTIKRMIDAYCAVYGYARPEFEVKFMPELPDTLVIDALNLAACKIAETYSDHYEAEATDEQ